jgi:hypothetical protein
MQELDQLIQIAVQTEGKQEDVNKVYLTLLKTSLWVPVQKDALTSEEEPFIPLFMKLNDAFFMAAFSSLERLMEWAGDQYSQMDYVELPGREVISGIKEDVYLCLNLNTPFYKEFSPDEIKRLKMVVARIKQLSDGESSV